MGWLVCLVLVAFFGCLRWCVGLMWGFCVWFGLFILFVCCGVGWFVCLAGSG